MNDEDKKEIYSVAAFPHDDLRSLIAGSIPDKDFSNAKPPNQVNSNTFATYLEPYFRALTDEDLQWLKERVSLTAQFREYKSKLIGRPSHTIYDAPPGKQALSADMGRRRFNGDF